MAEAEVMLLSGVIVAYCVLDIVYTHILDRICLHENFARF